MTRLRRSKPKETLFINGSGDASWIGGLYYRRNVLYSLSMCDELTDRFDIVVFTNHESKRYFEPLISNSCHLVVLPRKRGQAKLVKAMKMGKSGGVAYPAADGKAKRFLRIRPIEWIPDFQEHHYPCFFSKKELARRYERNRAIASSTAPLVLSSNDAKSDFKNAFPDHRCPVYVCHFVSFIEPEMAFVTPEYEAKVLDKYSFSPGDYFCVSNQFWAHKNHNVVLDAISLLSGSNWRPRVLFTGQLSDYRDQAYVKKIARKLNYAEQDGSAIVAGLVNRSEQLVLLRNARAVIQPSLFEGWGTVLEDCKALGVRAVLSDIPVHHEQCRTRDVLFNPHDPEALARIMLQMWEEPFERPELAYEDTRRRALEYGRQFLKAFTCK